MNEKLLAGLAGVLFGAGLAVSQMVNPAKVLAFLDVAGRWDPSLMLVLGGAVVTNFVAFRLTLRRSAPLAGGRFHVPAGLPIDGRLLGGSAIFGIGWGLAGYCPGPALSALTLGSAEPVFFVLAMLAGMVLFDLMDRRLAPAH